MLFTNKEIKSKISSMRKTSNKKGLTSNINKQNSKHLFEMEYCQISGMKLERVKSAKSNCHDDTVNLFTFDRINRFEGYNIYNILVVCNEANKIKAFMEKHNYTESQDNLINIIKKVRDLIVMKYENDKNFSFDPTKAKSPEEIVNKYLNKKTESGLLRFKM